MTKKITIGSMESDAPGDIVSLLGAVNNQYETLQSNRTATGGVTTNYYQVPTGYSLVITNLYLKAGLAGNAPVIGYGDDAKAAGAVAPTNAVGLTTTNVITIEATSKIEKVPVFIVVPAGKYPYMYAVGAVELMATGFLLRT